MNTLYYTELPRLDLPVTPQDLQEIIASARTNPLGFWEHLETDYSLTTEQAGYLRAWALNEAQARVREAARKKHTVLRNVDDEIINAEFVAHGWKTELWNIQNLLWAQLLKSLAGLAALGVAIRGSTKA